MSKNLKNKVKKQVRRRLSNIPLFTTQDKSPRVFLSFFWFMVGSSLTALFLISFIFISVQSLYKNKIYEGIFIDNIYVGGKTEKEAEELFNQKNEIIARSSFIFDLDSEKTTISAAKLNIGYNSKLIAYQAYSLGRSEDLFTNFYIIANAYLNGIFLPASYTFSPDNLTVVLKLMQDKIYQEPIDALFTVSNNKVIAFRQSSEGKTIDFEKIDKTISEKLSDMIKSNQTKTIFIKVPIKVLRPSVPTEKANNFGIVEIIGQGQSSFVGSIPNRIHNVTLAASRINGVLVAPSEVFSFNKALGDISKYTGYKEAYIIKDGRTILGDGGGVCQVSTTLFRAILNAGLPVIERHAHSYRVGYYEQNSPPGIDATVYSPTEDLSFKNDMQNHILIQSFVDPTQLTLSFIFYGKKDSREVTITTPVINNQTPPPPPLYQDDPTLAKGVVKQVDYEAWGANISFKRTVTKNGTTIINDTFISRYSPWQAVFLKGTKE